MVQPPRFSPRLSAFILLTGVTIIWGWTFVIVEDAIRIYGVLPFLACRFLIAGTLSLMLWGRRLDRKTLMTGMIIGVLLASGYLLQTSGLLFTTATNAGLITGLFVVLAPIADRILFGKRLRPAAWGAVGLSLVGMSLLTGRLPTELARGDLLVLGCALAFGLHIAILNRFGRGKDPLALTTAQMLGMMVVFVLMWPAAGEIRLPPHEVFFALFLTGIIASAVAYAIQTAAQQVLSTVETALILTLEPVFAGIFGYILAGERLDHGQLLGAFLMITAVALAQLAPLFPDQHSRNRHD